VAEVRSVLTGEKIAVIDIACGRQRQRTPGAHVLLSLRTRARRRITERVAGMDGVRQVRWKPIATMA
jgi:hypothetical protein